MPRQPDLLCWPCTVNCNSMSPFFVPLKEVKYQLNSTSFYDESIHAGIEVWIELGFKVISYLKKNMRGCHLPSLHSLTLMEKSVNIYTTHMDSQLIVQSKHITAMHFFAPSKLGILLLICINTIQFYSSVSTLSNFTGLSLEFQTWR